MMAYDVSVTINVLPSVGSSTRLYGQAINNANSALTTAIIISAEILYGNAAINQSGGETYFIAQDVNPLAILLKLTVTGTDSYVYIFYTKAVYAQAKPNNFMRISQKVPLGTFKDISNDTLIGKVIKAKALMADDYYDAFFDVQKQVFSSEYSPELEFEYNGTVGLLSTSSFPTELFYLFSTMATYGLNAYDLELFISQYIYFRIGVTSPVYIVNDPDPIQNYWLIGILAFTQFDQTPPQTVIAPDDYNPVLENIAWTIYNASSFTDEFKDEITNFINRISRADIGNIVTFSNISDPTTDGFTLIGPTYKNDPRLIFRKCLKYIDKSNYPLNIIGYLKNS